MSIKKISSTDRNNKSIQKDSGRGLPVTNTSTPMPPTKPPASKGKDESPKKKSKKIHSLKYNMDKR